MPRSPIRPQAAPPQVVVGGKLNLDALQRALGGLHNRASTLEDVSRDGSLSGSIDSAVSTLSGSVSSAISSTTMTTFNVKAYGAKGDNRTDDSAAIQAALNDAGRTIAGVYGGFVYLPKGIYVLGTGLTIPNGVGLMGSGPASSMLRAASNFNGTTLVRNQNQDGTQEYAFIEKLFIDGNWQNGAVITNAVVDLVSLFVNSYVRDCIVVNGSNIGIHIGTGAAAGPLLVENVWVAVNQGHNFVIDEAPGFSGGQSGVFCIGLTSENQGAGKAAVVVSGSTASGGHLFLNTHIENGRVPTTGSTGILIDGAQFVIFDNTQIFTSSPAAVTGVLITNNARNVGLQFRNLYNPNLIAPLLYDQKNGASFGTGNIYQYLTPEIGTFPDGEQVLTYATTVATDMSKGNFCQLVVSTTGSFTLANPTNAQPGMVLTYEITNVSGGAMGTITWGSDFSYRDSSWSNPVNGRRRTISFKRRGGGNWVQLGAASGDM